MSKAKTVGNAVGQIMSANLVTVPMTENAQEAAKKMRQKRVSSLLVISQAGEEENPIGIVTERDLVDRVCAEGISGREVKVSEIMSSPVATVERGATVETAADLMLHNNVRHLLVVDDKTRRPIGILAPRDLNKYLQANIDWDEVSARILEAIQSEERPEQVEPRDSPSSAIRKLSVAEVEAEKVAAHFLCSTCGAIFSTEQDRRQHQRNVRHDMNHEAD